MMPCKLTNIMAARRPFVVTALPETELSRVTAKSQAGILVPPEDAPALAQAILTLASKEAAREELGKKARRYAETWLGGESILLRLENLLYQLTNTGLPSSRRPGRIRPAPAPEMRLT
jgi:colanic acid biosynthesis glycosyl transferase WcaI